jgi:Rrf2 family transcriptional regulator, cysteine metabolism repressor
MRLENFVNERRCAGARLTFAREVYSFIEISDGCLFPSRNEDFPMKLSTRGRYGTRLMLELAKQYGKGPVSMSDISKNQKIPIKYLEQLIIPLKKAKLITSVRGPKGGHMLAKAPHEISLWEILLRLESKFTFVDCLADETCCDSVTTCPIRPVWGKAFESMKEIFENTTLIDVLNLPDLAKPKPGQSPERRIRMRGQARA